MERDREFQREYPEEEIDAKAMAAWFAEHLWVIEVMNKVIKATEDPFIIYYLQLPFKDLFRITEEERIQTDVHERETLYCSLDFNIEEIEFFRQGTQIHLFGFLILSREKPTG